MEVSERGTTQDPIGTPFFSGFIHPSLLTVSPLQQILDYLSNSELNYFCMTDHATHTFIWHRLVMKEPHQLSTNDWVTIEKRRGPIIRSVVVKRLIELQHIPVSLRDQIKEVRFRRVGGRIAPEWFPNQLEVFSSMDDNEVGYDYETKSGERYVYGLELPALPSTLRRFCFGFVMREVGDGGRGWDDPEEEQSAIPKMYESATSMIKRMLSQATSLTDVSISVCEIDIIADALPPTVERLNIHMESTASVPSHQWPRSLKHLTVMHEEGELNLGPVLPPTGLISLEILRNYRYYSETMAIVETLENLREIAVGAGIRSFGRDLFALLPRNMRCVRYDKSRYNPKQGLEISNETNVNSLPDTVEVLVWPLNNFEVKRWPSHLRQLIILGDAFAQDISNLPNTVEVLQLPQNYVRSVSKWPDNLIYAALGQQFLDLSAVECLPSSLQSLATSIPLARRLIKSGKLPRDLIRLEVLGLPNSSIPIDVRTLPRSSRYLTFDTVLPTVIGQDERPLLRIDQAQFIYSYRLYEDDMELNFIILNDPSISAGDIADPEETEPFLPKVEYDPSTMSRRPVPSEAELRSHALFYPEGSNSTDAELELQATKLHELSYEPPFGREPDRSPEFLDRLAQATPSQPIHGLSITDVNRVAVLAGVRDALLAGKIDGCFTMNESRWTRPPVVDDAAQVADGMVQLLAALSHSKISRVKKTMSHPFEYMVKTVVERKEEDEAGRRIIPITFSTFCTSISLMTNLRTLVFREFCFYQMGDIVSKVELLNNAILQSHSIENVDLGDITLGLGLPSMVELIKQTKTLKRLVLSHAGIKIGGIYQICQAVIGNESLVSLNLAGNYTSLAGLNVIRHALRHNRRIEITVCHLDFGSTGLDQLRQKRHRRLKESRCVYHDGRCPTGFDIELQ